MNLYPRMKKKQGSELNTPQVVVIERMPWHISVNSSKASIMQVSVESERR